MDTMFSKISDLLTYLALKISFNFKHFQIDNFELVLTFLFMICVGSTVYYKLRVKKLTQEHSTIKITSFFKDFTYVILFVLILRSVFYVPFNVTESDLDPEISNNSYVIVDRISLGIRLPLTSMLINFRDVDRFEIVKVRSLINEDGKNRIRHVFGRVIGVGGDKIVFEPNSLTATIHSSKGEILTYQFKASSAISDKRIEIIVPQLTIPNLITAASMDPLSASLKTLIPSSTSVIEESL